MCLAAKIEVKIVAGTAQPEAGRALYAINSRMVSGRNITRPPTLTRAIFLRWIQFLSVHSEIPGILAAWGTPSRGSMTSSNGAGAGWTGLGSVAMMLPCRTSIGRERRFDRAEARRSQGQEFGNGTGPHRFISTEARIASIKCSETVSIPPGGAKSHETTACGGGPYIIQRSSCASKSSVTTQGAYGQEIPRDKVGLH